MAMDYKPKYAEGMKKGDHHKYGDGISKNANPSTFDDSACCKGSPGYRTDFSETMQPQRGERTYPSVQVILGK